MSDLTVKLHASWRRHFVVFTALFIVVLSFSCVRAATAVTPQDMKKVSEAVEEEFSYVKGGLDDTLKNKGAAWAEGDYEFYVRWLKGIESEREGRFDEAIAYYLSSSKVERFEMSSHEVLLPLGRAYFRHGDKDRAISTLREFIKRAEGDLADPGPWGFTEEGVRSLRKRILQARWLIVLCEQYR